jgi:CrcB protein
MQRRQQAAIPPARRRALIAGAVGAPLRYLLDEAISSRAPGVFPWGTLVVNVTGSFLLGLLTGLVLGAGAAAAGLAAAAL